MEMDKRFADVIIDISHEKLDRPFSYAVPEKLRDEISVGMCVQVPFGKGNNLRNGFVIGFSDESDYPEEKMKPIAGISQTRLKMEENRIKLAYFMKSRYGGTMNQALSSVFPVKEEVKRATRKEVSLRVTREEAYSYLAQAKNKGQVGKVRLLEALLSGEIVSYTLLTGKLSVSPMTIKSMQAQGILAVEEFLEYRSPIRIQSPKQEAKKLTESQRSIAESFLEDYDKGIRNPALLKGVTGSGKTEVYMRLIEGMLQRGRQTIMLIPEIALTYQTVLRFYQRFGDIVAVMNSRLSPGEKYDQYCLAKEGKVKIMIGPRSALFTPFEDLGLIIIDEEHEPVYKSDAVPKYHAREVAIELAKMTDACVFMGSATPSLDAHYKAVNGEYRKYELKERIGKAQLPEVSLVDMCGELKRGNMSIFSRELALLMQQALDRKEQIMLFLNRRGVAGFVSCKACGHVLRCPHCDVSLSEHKNRMICHYCGYETAKVTKCPECGSKYIYGFRAGTEKVEEKVKEIFPGAKVLRMDADTTRKKGDYEAILASFASGEADILIGTQMIVKGHDFPNVTLVGVLAADLSLHASDYRAGERTFQLVTQAVGRAGRAAKPGKAVIQTYQPKHYSLKYCLTQDYDGFFQEEMAYRQLMDYPPAHHLLAILLVGALEDKTQNYARELASALKNGIPYLRLIGPAPASIGKINDRYRQVIYIKHEDINCLAKIKDEAEKRIKDQEENWQDIRVYFDLDPVGIF